MANIFRRRRSPDEDGGSVGGNVRRTRRRAAFAKTPYDRPKPPPPDEEPAPIPANPKWLAGFSFPARAIASGACKIFSTVLCSESSSSSSSSNGDTDSDHDDDVPAARDDEVELRKVGISQGLSSASLEPGVSSATTSLSFKTRVEKMRLIQQLVICETFSRKECEELIKLIQSRVVDGYNSTGGMEKARDLCSTAIMEDQMCETGQGALFPNVSESKTGSPMAMAKPYTDTRPAWSSPSLKHVEFVIPQQNSKEELSKSILLSPLKLPETKMTHLSAGSWNILEEIRKVRSKATEELLTSIASNANSNAPLEQGATNCCGFAESAVLEPERMWNEVPPTNTLMERTQEGVGVRTIRITGDDDGRQQPNEMKGSRGSAAAGHQFCLSATDQTPEPCDEEVTKGRNNPSTKSEHPTEGGPTGSQNSSSAQHEDSLRDAMRSLAKVRVRGTPAGTGRRGRGYSRRPRGRAKSYI